MSAPGLDPRVERGMRAQLALRRKRLDAGERPIGWKVGFGSPAALDTLGTDRPLVGFLTDRGVVPDGGRVSIGGWAAPMFEGEIAVHLGADIDPGASRETVRGAIAGLSAAIELADLDPPPTDVEAILAGNIFHRHVVLGAVDASIADARGITGRVLRDGEEVASADAPEAMTGEVVEVVRLAAEVLGACGERLRAGEVVITGSIVSPIAVEPGQRLEVELLPLGGVGVVLE